MTLANTAMIGSMPGIEPAAALAALAKFPLGIPTWPQLPKRSFKESMTVQYSEGFPGIRVDEKEKRIWVERDEKLLEGMTAFYEAVVAEDDRPFAISEAYAAGMHAFVKDRQGRRAPLVKGQCVGPFTFGGARSFRCATAALQMVPGSGIDRSQSDRGPERPAPPGKSGPCSLRCGTQGILAGCQRRRLAI